jgi:hypothetical protein
MNTPQGKRSPPQPCTPMLEMATPELYMANAFRITGLPVHSSAREISRHTDKLKLLEELGEGAEAHTTAFALNPPPSLDQIRAAVHRVRDPIQRILDEFFWFWPLDPQAAGADPGLRALQNGDPDAALKVWESLESHPTQGVAAMHNLAVLWHLCALEWEAKNAGSAQFERQDQYWRDGFKRWELLADDDALWELVADRVRALDDPQLSTGFVRRMRATLPLALDKINATLALRYAERDQPGQARKHITFMRESNAGIDNVDATIAEVLAPLQTRLRQQLESALKDSGEGTRDLAGVCGNLIAQARKTFAILRLFQGEDSPSAASLADETVEACNRMGSRYHGATGDNASCLRVLEEALPLAVSAELREQLAGNIQTLRSNLEAQKLKPAYELLGQIHESKLPPAAKLQKFESQLAPVLRSLATAQVSAEAKASLEDSVATVLRNISVDAWNEHNDTQTANRAHSLALTFARSSPLQARLAEDGHALRRNMEAIRANNPLSGSSLNHIPTGTGCLIIIISTFAIIGFMGISLRLGNGSHSSNRTSSTSTPSEPTQQPAYSLSTPPSAPTRTSYSPPAPPPTRTVVNHTVADGKSDSKTYRISNSHSAELSADEHAIELARSRFKAREKALEDLRNEIDAERPFLSTREKWAVEAFNRKVQRHNALAAETRESLSEFNALVNQYNSKLERYGR